MKHAAVFFVSLASRLDIVVQMETRQQPFYATLKSRSAVQDTRYKEQNHDRRVPAGKLLFVDAARSTRVEHTTA
jgi:hypothetical protein